MSIKSLAQRFDGWLNTLTGVGTNTNRTAFGFTPTEPLSDQLLSDLYRGDAFAARVVDLVPEHALRQGYSIETGDEGIDAAVIAKQKALNVNARMADGWTWARLYGGGAILVGADDGLPPEEPLNMQSIKSVNFLTVIDRREMFPSQWYHDPLKGEFGKASHYRLSRTSTGGGTDVREIHASRLIKFDGVPTDKWTRRSNLDWGDSVLQRLFDKLQQFNGAFAGVGWLMQDVSQGIFKMKGLASSMSSDTADLLKMRLQVMDTMRGIAKSIFVDADGEDYRRENTPMSGLPESLDKFMLYYAGAAGYPVTILFGQSPAGMNATGESDTRMFDDQIKAAQTNYLQPKIERLVRILLASKDGPTQGVIPAKVEIKFNPLRQPTPSEDAELRNKQAQTDVAYIQAQVVTPEEVAMSRFGAGGYSLETTVDLQAREAAMEADQSAVAQGVVQTSQEPAALPAKPPPADPLPKPGPGRNGAVG